MNPYQTQARTRKIIYSILILALFTVSVYWKQGVGEKAFALQLRETARGEVELTSSALRLILTGSHGLATTFLWAQAIKKQERHEWNELEKYVRSITKLQPYFVTPWIFQSWNLSFNVAVEHDKPRDKYYYVTRGMEFLAEGERRNQGSKEFPGNPDMRHFIGFTYHLKIGIADERNAMRCLLDLSCIDPVDRNPEKLKSLEAFRDFCKNHPRLIRRLREQLYYTTPAMIVEYLREHRDIPGRYEKYQAGRQEMPLKDPIEQIPVLPPPGKVLNGPDTSERDLLRKVSPEEEKESIDCYLMASAWWSYSMEPLPPPLEKPGVDEPNYNLLKHRIPRHMTVVIFRSYPARGQEYIAEKLEEEGWFDEEGWTIEKWFAPLQGSENPNLQVGTEKKYHAGRAWGKAYRMYKAYGDRNGLYIPQLERQRLERIADQKGGFRDQFKAAKGIRAVLRSDLRQDQELNKSYEAHQRLAWSSYYRALTNFDGHLYQCEAEQDPEILTARKWLFQAERYRRIGLGGKALAIFRDAWPLWIGGALNYPRFHQVANIQDDVYELQLSNLREIQKRGMAYLPPVLTGLAQFGHQGLLPAHLRVPGSTRNLAATLVTADLVANLAHINMAAGLAKIHKVQSLDQISRWSYPSLEDLLDRDQKEKRNFEKYSIRQVRGPLDWVMVNQFADLEVVPIPKEWEVKITQVPGIPRPERKSDNLELREFLLLWTTGASLGPRMIYPGQPQRMLTYASLRDDNQKLLRYALAKPVKEDDPISVEDYFEVLKAAKVGFEQNGVEDYEVAKDTGNILIKKIIPESLAEEIGWRPGLVIAKAEIQKARFWKPLIDDEVVRSTRIRIRVDVPGQKK